MKKRVLLLMLLVATVRAEDWLGNPRVLAGLAGNVPHPVTLTGELTWPKWALGIGAGGFFLPVTVNSNAMVIGIWGVDVRGRWYPFDAGFYGGLAIGFHNAFGNADATIPITVGVIDLNIPTYIYANIFALSVAPFLGWTWILSERWSLHSELGVYIPFSPSSRVDVVTTNYLEVVKATTAYRNLEDRATTFGNTVGRMVLPYVTLLKVGYQF